MMMDSARACWIGRILAFVAAGSVGATTGCGGGPDDESAANVQEALTFVPGSSVVSRFANPAATYLSSRSIQNLVTVGAMSNVLTSVAQRVDGIIDNKPANGKFSTDELERMELPQYFATLFPTEQAEFPKLWTLLEAPPEPAVDVPAATRLVPRVTDLSTPAGTLHTPDPILIATLTAAWQEPARRLQLVLNADADPVTVSQADIEAVIASPGRFTDADLVAFVGIRKEFKIRGTSDLFARISVPLPETDVETLATLGPLSLQTSFATTYSEQRTALGSTSSTCSWSIPLLSERRIGTPILTLPAGAKSIFIHDSGTEAVQTAGTIVASGGFHVIEVWDVGGNRIFSVRANLPGLGISDQSLDLRPYADYQFTSDNGTLFRNGISTSSTSSPSNTNYTANFAYQTTSKPLGSDTAYSAVATPPVNPVSGNMVSGRYPVPLSNGGMAQVDLYPQGVAIVTYAGQTMRLAPHCSGFLFSTGKKLRGTIAGVDFVYYFSTREFSARLASGTQEVLFFQVLDPGTRSG